MMGWKNDGLSAQPLEGIFFDVNEDHDYDD